MALNSNALLPVCFLKRVERGRDSDAVHCTVLGILGSFLDPNNCSPSLSNLEAIMYGEPNNCFRKDSAAASGRSWSACHLSGETSMVPSRQRSLHPRDIRCSSSRLPEYLLRRIWNLCDGQHGREVDGGSEVCRSDRSKLPLGGYNGRR